MHENAQNCSSIWRGNHCAHTMHMRQIARHFAIHCPTKWCQCTKMRELFRHLRWKSRCAHYAHAPNPSISLHCPTKWRPCTKCAELFHHGVQTMARICPPLSHHCPTIVPPLSHHCPTIVPPLSHHCPTIVPPNGGTNTVRTLYKCTKIRLIVPPLSHHCPTIVPPLSHNCPTIVPPLSHRWDCGAFHLRIDETPHQSPPCPTKWWGV